MIIINSSIIIIRKVYLFWQSERMFAYSITISNDSVIFSSKTFTGTCNNTSVIIIKFMELCFCILIQFFHAVIIQYKKNTVDLKIIRIFWIKILLSISFCKPKVCKSVFCITKLHFYFAVTCSIEILRFAFVQIFTKHIKHFYRKFES